MMRSNNNLEKEAWEKQTLLIPFLELSMQNPGQLFVKSYESLSHDEGLAGRPLT